MGMYATNSMLPIVLSARYGFDALHVGYTMTLIAIMRLVAGIWIAVPVMKRFGAKFSCASGTFVTGSFLLLAVYAQNVWLCIFALTVSRMGGNIRQPAFGALQVEVSQPESRGRMFSLIQSFENVGMLIGPLVAGCASPTRSRTSGSVLKRQLCLVKELTRIYTSGMYEVTGSACMAINTWFYGAIAVHHQRIYQLIQQ